MSIWDKERQLVQRRKPKQPISREKFQEAAEKQEKLADAIRRKLQTETDKSFIAKRQGLPPKPPDEDLEKFIIPRRPSPRVEPEASPVATGTSTFAGPHVDTSSSNNGLPPLYECAERLKERIHLLFYQKNLYGFNGRCYDLLSADDVIRLYRSKVDNKLGGEKSLWGIKQLYQYLLTDSTIAAEKITGSRQIAVLRNGIYDVMTGQLRRHSHKEIAFSWVDAEYCESGKCKNFHKFLRDVTSGDEVLQERMWQALGYMLTQSAEAKTFFVMGTAPSSGKSLLGNFIESLFDERYVSNVALNEFNRPFELAPIAGAAVNVSLDLPSARLNADAVSALKRLTGGDGITINPKYVSPFRYRSRAKLLFASNFPLELVDRDDAFWDRVTYLPFDYTIPREMQNPMLPELFQQERDSIVSEALRHVRTLVENNFQFPTTPLVERRMQDWQGRSCATIENFLHDCCIQGAGCKGELMDTLFSAYEQYCDLSGFVAKSRIVFKQFLENEVGLRHFKMRDGGENPQSAFRGIKLVEVRYD